MRTLRSWLGVSGILALILAPAPAGAQAVGSEFQVNTYTTSYQQTDTVGGRLVAADAGGNFVIVWQSYGQDGSNYGIFGQRYDSTGGTLGTEFRINSYTPGTQRFPSVASDESGNFVVVWESDQQEGSSDAIFGQRYDSAGVPLGSEFRVNTYTTSGQSGPSVASDASGNFIVVWTSYAQDGSDFGIFGQRYDSTGVVRGDEFRVNSYTTSRQQGPSVASDASGNLVVVWHSYSQDGSGDGIFGQRYDSAGVAQGGEFRVNTYTTSGQIGTSVALDASGNFVVVWHSSLQDGSYTGVFGQRYDNAGVAQGNEFRVNSFTTREQSYPSVAFDASGDFVVVWESYYQDGNGYGIFGRRYDSTGVAMGGEFQINSFTSSFQRLPSVGATGTKQFVVTWESYQDGSLSGVFGQRFDFSKDTTPPSVTVAAPNGGEKLFTGSSYLIQWAASDDTALSSFDVSASVNGGGSFTPIAECQDLPDSATSCLWLAPGPPSVSALVRVAAEDTSGNSASDDSDAVFRIVAGTASVTVTSPNANVKWRIGSLRSIKWTHNLGLNSSVRIELDRDDDGTYEELIAAAAPASSATKGSFAWTVTGPPSATARVRVSWTGNPAVSDSSDVTFQIRP